MLALQAAVLSLEGQRLALSRDLARYLASPEGEVLSLWDPVTFAPQVLAKTRPAIVLADVQTRLYREACALGDYQGKSVVLRVKIEEVLEAQRAFAAFGPLWVPNLQAHTSEFLAAALDFQGEGDYAECAFFESAPAVMPPALLSAETVCLTAPCVEEVFPEVGTRSLKDEFFWNRVRAYENWLGPLNQQRRRDGVLQIGGWPEFVQSGEPDTFLAQYNLGIGDGGGIYVHFENATLGADIQMG